MAAASGWYPDPKGEHEQRYWDGDRWTDHIADPVSTAAATARQRTWPPLPPNSPTASPSNGPAGVQSPGRRRNPWMFVVPGVGLLAALAVLPMILGDPATTKQDRARRAMHLCEIEVSGKLKAPGTADFEGVRVAVPTTKDNQGEYIVTGSVDAQNSFGASLRNGFACQIDLAGDGADIADWDVVSVDV